MSGSVIIVALLLVATVDGSDHINSDPKYLSGFLNEPTWVYYCIPDEGCQRIMRPANGTSPVPIYTSIDVCRTVCGPYGGLWPKPSSVSLSAQTVSIHQSNLRYNIQEVPVAARSLVEEMTQVATNNLLAECNGNVTDYVDTKVDVYISVNSSCVAFNLDTDEKYHLDVQTRNGDVSVYISAETIYGARHGLETFTQLAVGKMDQQSMKCALKLVSGAKIRDHPAYKYRGFLLDTSRNFIPMDDIKRMIVGMAATKMNVFHWHLTDSHSFPFQSLRVPQFTKYGAYSPEEIYSRDEVKELIHYARVRGVRVVIEIDAPAHVGNGWQWGREKGLGDLVVCFNAQEWRRYCIEPPCGQLNVANPKIYEVLKDLYRDVAELLEKPALFHIGGDEVFFPCWESSEQILEYMNEKGYERNLQGYLDLWGEFQQKALNAWDEQLAEAGGEGVQPVMIWSSELTQAARIETHLDKNRYIIEVWEPLESPLLSQLLRLGYRAVSVPKNIWYLDHGFWGRTTYSNWRRMYSHYLPKDENMLGGEVAMWSEYVDTNNIDTRVWPRAAAVGERLWSDPAAGSPPQHAEPRLHRHRTRLLARGLHPDAVSPAWCTHNDGRCL